MHYYQKYEQNCGFSNPTGELIALPRPLVGLKGSISKGMKGMDRKGTGKGRKDGEARGEETPPFDIQLHPWRVLFVDCSSPV